METDKPYFINHGINHDNLYEWWPQTKLTDEKILFFKQYFEQHYHIHQIKSMFIIGESLGKWTEEQNISYSVRNFSSFADYTTGICSLKHKVEPIIDFILEYHSEYSQLILFLSPSLIDHILYTVEAAGLYTKFPFHKLRFCVSGEFFTERFRANINKICSVSELNSSIFSVYGSLEADFIGAESMASIAVRKLLHHDKLLAQQIGFPDTLPHFFHCYDTDIYIEEVDGELCITKWQGIPLVRYNLHDKVQLYSWKKLRDLILLHQVEDRQHEALYKIIEKAGADLPDVIAFFGKSEIVV